MVRVLWGLELFGYGYHALCGAIYEILRLVGLCVWGIEGSLYGTQGL